MTDGMTIALQDSGNEVFVDAALDSAFERTVQNAALGKHPVRGGKKPHIAEIQLEPLLLHVAGKAGKRDIDAFGERCDAGVPEPFDAGEVFACRSPVLDFGILELAVLLGQDAGNRAEAVLDLGNVGGVGVFVDVRAVRRSRMDRASRAPSKIAAHSGSSAKLISMKLS